MKNVQKKVIIFLVALFLIVACVQISGMEAKAADGINVSGATYPDWIRKGDVFVIRGTVSSSTNITSLTASICDSDGKAVYSKTVYPNRKNYDLRGIDAAMRFDKLSANPFTYRVVATNGSGTHNVIIKPFTVYYGSKPRYVTNLDTSKKYKICVQEDSGMIMDIEGSGNGTNVLVKRDSGQATAGWYLEKDGGDCYAIRHAETGMCLDVKSGSYINGANVQLWSSDHSDEQKWYFIKDGDAYKIISKKNHLTLSLQRSVAENKPNVDMWRDIQAAHQRFYVKAVGERPGDTQNKTLSINWNNIKKVGNQAGKNRQGKSSDSCMCFALAYCRTILDGKAYSWKDFNANGKNGSHSQYNSSGWYSKANYTSKTPKSQGEVFRAAYDSINADKPMIVWVKGKRSSWHFVTIVGYEKVKSRDSLAAENFLIIDSCPGTTTSSTENMKKAGYSLKKNGSGKYRYLAAK